VPFTLESRSNQPRQTPLSRLIDDAEPATRKATPLDVLARARSRWLAGERIDIGKIAQELGVGRATVFRWVGSRENLYGEVCSELFAKEIERARSKARGHGLARLVDIMEHLLRSLATAKPLRRFVAEDPEFALRVLTSRASPVQHRCTVAIREQIDEAVSGGHLVPALPPDELAYIIVRITESFLYRDVLTGDVADIEAAIRAIRVLLGAPVKPAKARARR
jgi:AcrR family transcriptional regulator